MSYGTHNFRPVPIVSLNRSYELSEGGDQLGLTVALTLEGTVVATGADGEALHAHSIVSIDEVQDRLASGIHSQNGELFLVKCSDTTLISGYPIVKSIVFPPSSSQWVSSSPYTIELEYYEPLNPNIDPSGYYIKSATEDWSFDLATDRYPHSYTAGSNPSGYLEAILNHNVSAVGKSVYESGGLTKPAWQRARDYVLSKVDEQPDSTFVQISGIINLPSYSGFDHTRTAQIGELGGSFSMSETWRLTKNRIASEDFTITVRSGTNDGLTSVSVNGNVVGFARQTYGNTPGDFTVVTNKYAAASGYFKSLNIYGRVNGIGVPNLNIKPLTVSVGHNPPQGTISYDYEYNDRPSFCVSNSAVLSEVINITDTNPTDVFAALVVCGRERGPVLQDISTVNVATREASVELLIKPTGGCLSAPFALKGDVETFLESVYDDLTDNQGANAQVFKHQDQEVWNLSQGKYSRTIGWTYQTDSTTKSLGA